MCFRWEINDKTPENKDIKIRVYKVIAERVAQSLIYKINASILAFSASGHKKFWA